MTTTTQKWHTKKTIFMNTQPHKVAWIATVVRNIASSSILKEDYNFITIDCEHTSQQSTRTEHTQYGLHITTQLQRPIITTDMNLIDITQASQHIIDLYIKKLLLYQPDLVVIHWTYIIPWCLLQATRQLNIPHIIYYHWVYRKEAHYTNDDQKIHLAYIIESDFLQWSAQYIFPSQLTKETVRTHYDHIFDHTKTHIIHNGVPWYYFKQKYPLRSHDRIRVWFCMSRSLVKNKDFVLRFIQENINHWSPFDIHIVSRGNLSELDHLKDHITLREPMSHDKLPTFFQSIDITLSPSVFETYGNVAVESRALWTPAIVHQDMGVKEVFETLNLHDYVIDFSVRTFTYYQDIITQWARKTHYDIKNIKNQLEHHIWLSHVNTQRKQLFDHILSHT